MSGSPLARLAEFLASAAYDDLPERAREHAKMAVSSTLASAAAGAGMPSARLARELALEHGGAPEATLWFGAGERVPAVEAAAVNAMLSDAAACDDSDFRTIAHSGTTVCAATLAIGERVGAGGREAIAAIAAGYEACGRFGEATSPRLGER
ncbi:MAG TPA: MmgE/PrpD family protein, partial [Solirubrobacteraceae bacterium]|nr:MmgE/PrpD family protein [Solirubrobacteraceae bacterium]